MSDNFTLPFNQLKQSALLGHLLVNEKFFKLVQNKIKPSYFISERMSKVFDLLNKYYEKYKTYPKREEFRGALMVEILDPKERNNLLAYITKAISDTQWVRLDLIKPELTEWLHSVILMRALTQSQDLFNNQKIKECHIKLMEAVKEVSTTSFNNSEAISFLNYKEYLVNAKEDRKEAITTGLDVLDKCLLDGATGGGLQKGDTTIVMAPVNIGKSTFLISVICANVIKGKDILYMTHEGKPEDLRLMLIANLLKCTRAEVIESYKDDAKLKKLELATNLLEKHLKYIPYNKAGAMTIENVVPIIRSAQEEWQALHSGKGFDLLVSDYPGKLGTDQAKKGNMPPRFVDKIVYDEYIQLALEYNLHALLAIQTNREGSKVNKGITGDGRLLGMEDVKESWDPMAGANNVITLNRSPKSVEKGLIILNIAKSRSNKAGLTIYAKSDFPHCNTHSNELGAFAYEGLRNAESQVEELWGLYQNRIISDNELYNLKSNTSVV